MQPIHTIKQSIFKDQTGEDILSHFISNSECTQFFESPSPCEHIMSAYFWENCDLNLFPSSLKYALTMNSIYEPENISIEISPRKTLKINSELHQNMWEKLIKVLQKQAGPFALEYNDIRHIQPHTCMHHMYMCI